MFLTATTWSWFSLLHDCIALVSGPKILSIDKYEQLRFRARVYVVNSRSGIKHAVHFCQYTGCVFGCALYFWVHALFFERRLYFWAHALFFWARALSLTVNAHYWVLRTIAFLIRHFFWFKNKMRYKNIIIPMIHKRSVSHKNAHSKTESIVWVNKQFSKECSN